MRPCQTDERNCYTLASIFGKWHQILSPTFEIIPVVARDKKLELKVKLVEACMPHTYAATSSHCSVQIQAFLQMFTHNEAHDVKHQELI